MIPFNRPLLVSGTDERILEAYRNRHVSGNGPFTRRCEDELKALLGSEGALLTTSCTHALEMCALLLDLSPGDEVVLPSFTFVSTANAFVLRGATPVFVDSRPDTLNIDETKIEAALTEKTRAIVVVHYAGVACDLDAIGDIARRHGLPIIEDNAHGLLGAYRGRPLGSVGRFSTLSFHETKNLSCGEGGALVLNKREDLARAEILREKGTDRAQFFRGETEKYSWRDLGSSYVPSDILAAVLSAQLDHREQIQARRHEIWHLYHSRLADWALRQGVQLPVVPAGCEPAWHLYHLLVPSAETRPGFLDSLMEQGVQAVFHYLPLEGSPFARARGFDRVSCPVSVDVSERLVRLPLYYDLTPEETERIIESVTAYSF